MNNTISLYGLLARKFQKKYNYNPKNIPITANTARDVVLGLEANFKGFKSLIKKSGAYKIANGSTLTHGDVIDKEQINMKFGNYQWHIMPVANGSGKFGQIIIGVALIAASFIPGLNVAVAGYLLAAGVMATLGGIAALLTPNPMIGNYGDREKSDEKPSYLFDGPKNTVEPGLTIPLVYGECFIGSITVSGGLRVIKTD